ncbi:hypothetical protein AYJ57_15795 [Salipiger sp. CCB-MM3]|nr:hypothetical protein AYJ57_15795 [Salipiger sp. CCB-MM3]
MQHPAYEADYTIYPNIDGIRTSAPWRLGDYLERGMLSEAMIYHLSDHFALAEQLVRSLSVMLGNCLDDDGSAIVLVEVNRAQAIAAGQKELRRLLRGAKRGGLSLSEVRDGLASLSTVFAKTPRDASLLPKALSTLAEAANFTDDIFTSIARLLDVPGAAAVLVPRDKRKVMDKRRQYVIESCCHVWLDDGRPLTYTTVSDGSKRGQRHGPLIEFIQAVVRMITQPSSELSGETIRVDIDHFRAEIEKPDPLFDPPEFKNGECADQYT